jgi:small subunit ribosomal protein S17
VRSDKPKKTLTGTVVSDKMDKVATIQLEIRKRHPLYEKFVTRHKKLKVRNSSNEAVKGDVVKIVETRPSSKDVYWKITEIVEKAQKG